MLATPPRPIAPPAVPAVDVVAELAASILEQPDALELEAVLGAIDDRLETATPDVAAILRAGRRRLELELANLLAR